MTASTTTYVLLYLLFLILQIQSLKYKVFRLVSEIFKYTLRMEKKTRLESKSPALHVDFVIVGENKKS